MLAIRRIGLDGVYECDKQQVYDIHVLPRAMLEILSVSSTKIRTCSCAYSST